MKQQNEINWSLAGKILSGEANMEEENSFNDWLSNDRNRLEWKEINSHMEKVDYSLIADNINSDKAWKKVNNKTSKPNTKKIIISILTAASIVLTFFVISTLTKNQGFTKIITARNINSIELSDGSIVELNRFSSMKYPKTFEKSQRNVTLEGEAFFNITKDKEKPFVIRTNKLAVEVVGTSFNVKAYPNKQIQEVTVKKGIIKVSSISKPQSRIILHPGEKAIYSSIDSGIQKQSVKNENYISWKTKEFNFKNEKLSQVLNLLEEVYYITISIPENTDLNILYTANFNSMPIENIIRTINSTFSINLTFKTKN